jgi:hypothetical protein
MASIRVKRKPRDSKTCRPCRATKVKCDRKAPCGNCIKHHRADLCLYGNPSPEESASTTLFAGSSNISLVGIDSSDDEYYADRLIISQREWQETLSDLKALLHETFSRVEESSLSIQDRGSGLGNVGQAPLLPGDEAARTIFTPALEEILNKSRASNDMANVLVSDTVLPILGLENQSVTYPFIDLWSSSPLVFNPNSIFTMLPDDTLCRGSVISYPVCPSPITSNP